MKIYIKKFFLFFYLFNIPYTLVGMDNPQFYAATQFFPALQEPRIVKNGLSSLDIVISGGATSKARNGDGCLVPLLSIYGPQNMQLLGAGLPLKDLSDPFDITLTQLALLPRSCNFGCLLFDGRFSIFDSALTWTQNYACGFFSQVHLPIRWIKISDVTYCDISSSDSCCINQASPIWQTLIGNLCPLLKQYHRSISGFSKKGVGDLVIIAGWGLNYEETEELDFIDLSLRVGLLIPTSAKTKPERVFDIPLGYNGQWGIPMSISFAVGVYDWLTLGTFLGVLPFAPTKRNTALKTNPCQNGFIKLATGCACINPGPIWQASAYVKADHVIKGLSFLFGYTFVNKNADQVTPSNNHFSPCSLNNAFFSTCTVATDQQFFGWNMHTLHFMVEYDFTKPSHRVGPRLGAFIQKQLGGKRVFATNLYGGNFGIEFSWTF